jgi:UDPglucose--hexose-1-phosphate uridylyltransferase
MGCSNPHPHGQVWSLSEVPTLPATELASLQRYRSSAVSMPGAPKGPEGACLLSKFGVVVQNSYTV